MKIDLSDKTIIITGALGAISEAVVRALIEAGAYMILTDAQSPADAARIIEERGHDPRRCEYHQMDVTDAQAVHRIVDACFARHPKINIALSHAGGTRIEHFADTSDASFDKVVAFNLLGPVYFSRAVLRHWSASKTKGHLIFTSTYISKFPWKGISGYTAAKAGVDMFSKSIALEYAPLGIRSNVVAPGNVAAGSSKLLYETDADYRRDVDKMSPLGHRNSPESIANAFLYLCSPLADEVTGAYLNVDAGVGLPKVQD
ncbi:MAG: hypothetical protein RL095_668 [Verrucomicrobiota bacterium]|jgi:NAD(P)-dependent dehydrogenase (short-subunit alcohol dehydrogenase family)